MKKAIIFFDPKGTIFEVVKLAYQAGYYPIALSSDMDLMTTQKAYQVGRNCILEIHLITSWSDNEAIDALLINLSGKYELVGFYGGMDACAVQVARWRQITGLPTTDPSKIEGVLNKYKMRSNLLAHGLSSLRVLKSNEFPDGRMKEWPFKNSAYFKPTHGSFSALVLKCSSKTDFKAAYTEWREIHQSGLPLYLRNYIAQGDFLLEEEIEGELMSVEGISSGGKFYPLGLLSRILYSNNPVVEMGSCFPYSHPMASQIIELVRKAHTVLGITEGPTHTEVIVGKDGRIEIIDFNPRFVGADVLQSINLAYDVKIEKALLDFALGLKPTLPTILKQYSCLQYFLTPAIQQLDSVSFPLHPQVMFTSLFKKIGEPVSGGQSQIDYLGCYLITAASFEEALQNSFRFRSEIRINDVHAGVF